MKYMESKYFSILFVAVAVAGTVLISTGSVNAQQETIARGQDGQSGQDGSYRGNGTAIDGADGQNGADGIVEGQIVFSPP
jgi:hypothetical protein